MHDTSTTHAAQFVAVAQNSSAGLYTQILAIACMQEQAYWDVLHATHLIGYQDSGAVKRLPLNVCQLLYRYLPAGFCLTHNLHIKLSAS